MENSKSWVFLKVTTAIADIFYNSSGPDIASSLSLKWTSFPTEKWCLVLVSFLTWQLAWNKIATARFYSWKLQTELSHLSIYEVKPLSGRQLTCVTSSRPKGNNRLLYAHSINIYMSIYIFVLKITSINYTVLMGEAGVQKRNNAHKHILIYVIAMRVFNLRCNLIWVTLKKKKLFSYFLQHSLITTVE